MVNTLKPFRRITTRSGKTARNFLGVVPFGAMTIRLKGRQKPPDFDQRGLRLLPMRTAFFLSYKATPSDTLVVLTPSRTA